MNEFERIAEYLAPLSEGAGGAFGLADDVAALDAAKLVITTDTIIQNVHYIGDEPADMIARKLLRVNLSDLAAKGAVPRYYTLNLTLTAAEDDAWFATFCKGLEKEQAEFGITLIGGDSTTAQEGGAVLSATLFGYPPEGASLPLRSNARVSDVVCVSGTLGDAAIGLKLLKKELLFDNIKMMLHFIRRYQLPEPRLALGQTLAPLMHASMDISDGLMQDAAHIADGSGVGINIHAGKLPLAPGVDVLLKDGSVSWDDIVGGGDDYEICCTLPKKHLAKTQKLAKSLGVEFSVVGEVVKGAGVGLLDDDGNAITLNKRGFTHR